MTPSPDHPLRLGTRSSPLALVQARMAADALRKAHGLAEDVIVIVPLSTRGDEIQDRPLAEAGGKALWTETLDRALIAGHVDACVHSMKDVETVRPTEIVIAALLPRADVRDRLLGAASIDALPKGACIGTSSPRRTAQLSRLRPDLRIGLLRGNVATRIAAIEAGRFDATLLAAAGLERLGRHDVGTAIPPETLLPAPAQGAIGIETLGVGDEIRALLAAVDHAPTRVAVETERALLAGLGADCRSPVAALATAKGDRVRLAGQILTLDGREEVSGSTECASGEAPKAAHTLARELLERAGPELRALFAA